MKISVVVPMYNEEEVMAESYKRLAAVMDTCEYEYELVFINDGSKDKTMEIMGEVAKKDNRVKLINFSRNFGHQIAISAGIDYAKGDAVIIIDADLQDPPEVMLEMIKKWEEGYDVVYGKRLKRKGETAFKKLTAKMFYRTLNSLTSVDMPVDTGDFRLISRRVCETLKKIGERNRFMRGIVSWIGYKQTEVTYVREERFAGETKYPLKKMLKLASDGIVSFSYKPLKISIVAGTIVAVSSFIYLIVVIIQRIFFESTIQIGWASMIAITLFLNGFILLMLGIIGQYIGRIYEESKARPLYIVQDLINMDNEPGV